MIRKLCGCCLQTIQYTLPKMARPMTKSESRPAAAPGSEPSLTVALKSLRNPPLDLKLPAQPPATTILDLKQRVAQELSLPGADRVRLLYKKKPCSDSKSIKDVYGDQMTQSNEIEFSVMVVGGVSTTQIEQEETSMGNMEGEIPVAPGEESGTQVLDKAEFWGDLRSYLEQRVRDQTVADNATTIFKAAWTAKGGTS